MIRLSVNVNKIATIRNSRGGSVPSVLHAVKTCIDAGAPGITVHPRADARHIRPHDVEEIAALLASRRDARAVEFNIEGDPQPAFIDMVVRVRPHQCTLVPVTPGEITSHAGWTPDTDLQALTTAVSRMRDAGVRVSVFVDPLPAAVEIGARVGADRVELYTEPFAKAFAAGTGEASLARYASAALRAQALGLGVNAGHDLDLDNLRLFSQLPHLDEVSIGHALISRALWVGLDRVVREYLDVLGPGPRTMMK